MQLAHLSIKKGKPSEKNTWTGLTPLRLNLFPWRTLNRLHRISLYIIIVPPLFPNTPRGVCSPSSPPLIPHLILFLLVLLPFLRRMKR